MNLQQVKFVCEIADHGLNISRTAEALKVAQPAISRQIQLLEKEIGVTIFVRNRKRIISLSRPGEAILKVARRILQDTENLKKIGAQYGAPDEGDLTVATNHTYARYVLPSAIERYCRSFPRVRVSLLEGNPNEIGEWLATGAADLSISTKPTRRYDNLVFLPLETLHRVVVVPARHKLLRVKELALSHLAHYPIITFHPAFAGGENIAQAFKLNSLNPHFIVKAANADVIKAYVRRGLGIGIVSRLGVSATEDRDLRTLDVDHLFPSHQILVGLARGRYMQSYVHDFLKLIARDISRADIEKISGGPVFSDAVV
jgi:LysR family cys regulon transcriptional activator